MSIVSVFDRHEYLANKLVKYKKFEEYLMRVIEAMPEGKSH